MFTIAKVQSEKLIAGEKNGRKGENVQLRLYVQNHTPKTCGITVPLQKKLGIHFFHSHQLIPTNAARTPNARPRMTTIKAFRTAA